MFDFFFFLSTHQKAEKYTIIVEAKDHGESLQLSSSCTVIINIKDGNNHIPVITQQTVTNYFIQFVKKRQLLGNIKVSFQSFIYFLPQGPVSVKEGQENVLVTRLQVTDKDTKGTEAWRAKYQIQGDTNNNFRITTDPDTNEGLLYAQKVFVCDHKEHSVLIFLHYCPIITCEKIQFETLMPHFHKLLEQFHIFKKH